jgi:integrase
VRAITPRNNHGAIRLRFTYNAKRYNLSTGGKYGDPIDMAFAAAIAAKIQLDIKAGQFDATMQRYRTLENAPVVQRDRSLLALWDKWVDSLSLEPETKADHYAMLRLMIERAKPALGKSEWFIKAGEKLAPSTYNKRLGYLRRCLDWAVTEGLATVNPYQSMKSRKAQTEAVKPFTLDEITRILQGFRALHPTYAPFCAFMLATGCRTSEAIGLQWKRVDFERGEVTIADSTPKHRSGKGTHRKSTKTDSVTILDMDESLRRLLEALPRCGPDELVFKSPDGKHAIDRSNYRTAWVEVLEAQKVPYRKPYATRHTTASHAIDQGASLPDVAYILGHKDTRMVSQTYGHLINRPKLPKLID